jgi:hypothetical protein
MRVLVAGRNANVLATVAGTFVRGLKIQTATSKAAGIALLDAHVFDLVIACETLTDGSGLEVLSHVAMTAPNCLRIFAARPSTLIMLKGELGLFGLFRTLSYPINMRKLAAAVQLAQGCLDEEPQRTPAGTRAAVAGARVPSGAPVPVDTSTHLIAVTVRDVQPPAKSAAKLPRVPGGGPQASTAPLQAATQVPAAQPSKGRATPQRAKVVGNANATAQQANVPAANAPRQSPSGQRITAAPAPTQPTRSAPGKSVAGASAAQRATTAARIPPTEAFKRALAKRNASKLQMGDISSALQQAVSPQTDRNARAAGTTERREPSVRNESLAQLAQLTTIRRSKPTSRGSSGSKSKRKVFFVSTGVFAALAAGVLTFSILSANNSMARAPVPAPASIQHLIPEKVFPWQPAAAPTSPAAAPSPAPAGQTKTAAVETPVDGDAPPEPYYRTNPNPDYSAPPPPNAPPPPYQPPAADDPDDE